MATQNPADAPHLALPAQVKMLTKHIEHFNASGDAPRAAAHEAELRHTRDRLEHAKRAAAFVDTLGLSHEVTPDAVTYNDACNYVAKVLHEMQHGVTSSEYTRAHKRLHGAGLGADAAKHYDEARLNVPRDAAAEICAHLGLDPEKHMTAAKALVGEGG